MNLAELLRNADLAYGSSAEFLGGTNHPIVLNLCSAALELRCHE